MNNTWRPDIVCAGARMRPALWLVTITLLILATGCGGDGPPSVQTNLYPAGSKSDEDIDKELKFDARVIDYEAGDERLVVNVTQAFASSPPGIQQRALGNWYNLFQAARSKEGGKPPKGLAVVARHEENDVARWTGDKGYELVVRAKGKDEESGAGSEN